MRKLLVMLWTVCTVNLYAVNVYVGGVVMDGNERTPAYWLNGTMHFLSLYEPLPDGTQYGAMAVEHGNVYMSVLLESNNYNYNREVHVYKDGGQEVGEKFSLGKYVTGMVVINGKAYVGVEERNAYCIYKNGKLTEKNAIHMTAKNGVLYHTFGYNNNNSVHVQGYITGGYIYRNESSWGAMSVSRIRVIGNNLYMMGYDTNGACVQTNNTRRDNIEGYGHTCKDMAIVNGQYYYIIDEKLVKQNGTSILSSSYIPLQILGHESLLYILYKGAYGAIPEHFVGIYDQSTNRMTHSYKLPSCVGAYDFYVED